MKTFIRVAKVWLPDAGHTVRTHGAAVAGPEAQGFCTSSQGMRFKLGEGLPGLVWQQGRPMLLKKLHGLPCLRAEAARAARLSSAIALPVFVRGDLALIFSHTSGAAGGGLVAGRCAEHTAARLRVR